MRIPRALAVLGLLLAGASRVGAQDGNRGRIEVSGGVRWIGEMGLGAAAANESTPGGGTRPLFNSVTTLDGSVGGAAALGVRLSRLLRAELAFAYSPTHISSRVTSDAEGVADVTVREPVTQLTVEGGVLAQPGRWRTRRLQPFLTAGIGYLRQLNDGRTLVQSGQSYYVGGGLYYVRASARPGRLKSTGVRVDLRALILHGGVLPDQSAGAAPAIAAAVFARF